MKLSELIQRLKLQIPNMDSIGVSDTYLTTLLNQACDQVNLLTKVYRTYTDFDIVAEKRIYNLSTYVPLYLGTDKKGFFFKDSSGNWCDLIPKTEAWLAERYPDYLNASSTAIPRWIWIEGDELGLYPPPSTTLTAGARLYHLQKANAMSNGDDYPWSGNATEITSFIALDDALVAYCRFKISPAFGVVKDQQVLEVEFIREAKKGAMQVKRRRDLTSDSDYRMRMYR